MSSTAERWHNAFVGSENSVANKTLAPMEELVRSGKSSVSYNRKIMKKTVDLSWVDAIEEGLVHLDKVLRNPRVTIEDVEEIVPIALSRKTTVESIKHLAQHTNLIQSVDEKTGKITPSKILNIYKEESMLTYENKFINTLIDRLFIFVSRRYEKLKEVERDENAYSVDYTSSTPTDNGGSCTVTMKIEIHEVPDDAAPGKFSTRERIDKIKLAVDTYKGSKFCEQMGNAFIRPPVMRTNAIMKNVELKACLVLWQFIEGYDKVGYDIYTSDAAQNCPEGFVRDLGKIAAMDYMLLGYYSGLTAGSDDIKGKKSRSYTPKVLRKLNVGDLTEYDVTLEEDQETTSGYKLIRELPEDAQEITREIDKIIEIEKRYLDEEEEQAIEEKRAAEERERRRIERERKAAEEQRLAAERKRELERIAEEKRQKEEHEKKLRELAEQQKREEEERQYREEEERKVKAREEAEAAERARIEEEERIEEEKRKAEETAAAAAQAQAEEEQEPEETPEEIAERERKREEERAARLERERANRERAARLRRERALIESKPFEVIYAEYSKTPFCVIKRAGKKLLKALGMNPKTDKLTENELAIMEIEERLQGYLAEQRQAEWEEKNKDKAEKRRLDDLFDSYSSSSFAQRRIKFRKFMDKFRRR